MNRLVHDKDLTALASHPNNSDILIVGSKNEILLWDLRAPTQIVKKYSKPIGQVQSLLFVDENEFLSSGDVVSQESALYSIVAWDLKTTATLSQQIFHVFFLLIFFSMHEFFIRN